MSANNDVASGQSPLRRTDTSFVDGFENIVLEALPAKSAEPIYLGKHRKRVSKSNNVKPFTITTWNDQRSKELCESKYAQLQELEVMPLGTLRSDKDWKSKKDAPRYAPGYTKAEWDEHFKTARRVANGRLTNNPVQMQTAYHQKYRKMAEVHAEWKKTLNL